MPLRLSHIIFFVVLVCVSYNADAQSLGGNSSGGGDIKVLTQSACLAPENVSIYFGGNSSGAFVNVLTQTSCPTPENTDIYKGGSSAKAVNILTNCVAPENADVVYKGGIANGSSSSNIANCPVTVVPNFFTGGTSDGFSITKLNQSTCSSPENLNVLFLGGISDGYFSGSLSQSVCAAPENLNLFKGGNAEGFCAQSLNQQTCGNPENSNIFFGGDADGYGSISLTQCVSSTPENISIFLGGNADGFSQTSLNQTVCTYPENLDIFLGGNSDGFAWQNLQQTVCPAAENSNIFAGGNADGFSMLLLAQSSCATPENMDIFMGGTNDGFANISLTQSTCSTPTNSNIFFGGNSDGYAFGNITNCTPPENVNIYFGGNANGAGFGNIVICPSGVYSVNIYTGGDANGASVQVLRQKTCSLPENANIYFGGNANGAAIQKLQQKTCAAAENINIYFGGNANGASIQILQQKTCASPDNLNIYFGGNANGASIQVLQQKICASPDNLNIYFGGIANGADNKQLVNKTCFSPENWNIFFGGIADGYATTILTQSYYWTGAIDHNWHNPGNWSTDIVPDIYSPVIIPKVVNYPIVSQGVAFSKSIVVQLNMRLDIANKNLTTAYNFNSDGDINITGTPVLSVGGDLKCNGTFSSGSSKVFLNSTNGTQSVSINTGDFYDVEVSTASSAKAQLANSLTIRHNLNISTGTLDASSKSMTITGNWTNAASFNAGTGSVTFNGTYQTLTNTNGEQFYNLEVANNTNLVLNNNAIVANTLKFTSGTVSAGSNKLTIGSGISSPGNLQYTSGRVIGYLERWIASTGNYLFPVGTSGNMQSATITVNSGLVSGSVIGSFISSNPGNGGLPLTESGVTITKQYPEGYWSFSAANAFSIADYNVSFAANGFSTYYFNSDVRVIKRTNNGGWILDGTHANASFPNVYRNNLAGGISTVGTQFGLGSMDCIGGTIADNEIVCYNDDVAPFSSIVPAKGGDGNFTYTWQYSNNTSAVAGDSNWTDISSSNTPTFDYGNLQTSTVFIRKAVNVGCPSALYSNILLIKVGLKPSPGPVYKRTNL